MRSEMMPKGYNTDKQFRVLWKDCQQNNNHHRGTGPIF